MKAYFALAAASVAPSLSLSLLVQPSARANAYAAQAPCKSMPSPLAILSHLFLKFSSTILSSDTNGQHGGCCRSAYREASQTIAVLVEGLAFGSPHAADIHKECQYCLLACM